MDATLKKFNMIRMLLNIALLFNIVKMCDTKSAYNSSFYKIDLCSEIQECRCHEDISAKWEWALDVDCGDFPITILDDLPSSNITKLMLAHGTRGNATFVLERLSTLTKNLKDLKVFNNDLEEFQWNWLPDSLEKLTLSTNGIKNIVVNGKIINDCNYQKRRLPKMGIMSIGTEKITSIPDCIPDSTHTLLITECELSQENITRIRWPKSLRRFKIARNMQGHLPEMTFRNIDTLKNLTFLWIAYFPMSDGNLPFFPLSQNLSTLYVQRSNLTKIKDIDFMNLVNLNSLNLGGNNIKELSSNLPKSLKLLRVYENEIGEVKPFLLSNIGLTLLDLKRNKLDSVPMGLPETLTEINLSHNNIMYCHPDAFQDMKGLKYLDLSFNKLQIMPVGIHPGLYDYSLANNMLSHVSGPEVYDFCVECRSFKFGNNPLTCDENLVGMLIWVSNTMPMHPFKPSLSGRCSEMPQEAFDKDWLRDTTNYMYYISLSPFSNCTYKVQNFLNCTNQNLKYFPQCPTHGIKVITIEGNKQLTEIPDDLYLNLTTLQILNLDDNNLKRIPYGLPTSLLDLTLRGNNISELSARDVEVFHTLIHLEALFLEDNQLKTIYSTQVTPLISLQWIGLERNPLICDCSLMSFISWYSDIIPIRYPENTAGQYARCGYPSHKHDRDIRKLSGYYSYELNCIPRKCTWTNINTATLNCSIHAQMDDTDMFSFLPMQNGKQPVIPENTYWESVILDGLQLPDDEVQLKQLKHLITVDLSNNTLTKWPLQRLPPSVETLLLKRNRITYLPTNKQLGEFLPNLHVVDLRNNAIVTLDEYQLHVLPLMEAVQLGENPFVCNCNLRHFILWVQTNKNNHKLMESNQLQELTCAKPRALNGMKLMEITEEQFCRTYYVEIFGGLAGAIVFIILLVIFVSIYLQRKRKQYQRKEILRGFQQVLQQEATYANTDAEAGNPQKTFKYDAFVSSATDYEDGVFQDLLIQELELKRNYKLCIGQRDFIPGIGIADNIVQCIGASKRIILILSSDFVSSPWCQYEVQVALAELHQRRSKLFVPIMIEDLPSEVCGCIKSFLTLVPIIHVPSSKSSNSEWEKFWKSLTKSIPNELQGQRKKHYTPMPSCI